MEAQATFCASFVEFRQEMVKLFDRSARVEEAAAQLAWLCQGGSSVTELNKFKMLVAFCDSNEGLCRAIFCAGLNEEIQVEIATHKLPYGFNDLVDLALHVETCLSLRRPCMAVRSPWKMGELTSDPTPVLPSPSPADPKLMQLGQLCLTLQQKQEQFT